MDTQTQGQTNLDAVRPLAAAFGKTAAARAALSAEALVAPNLDARRAATIAMGAFAAAEGLFDEAARKLPESDLDKVRAIPELADALIYAQTAVDSEARDGRVLEALYDEAMALRQALLGDLKLAGKRGVVSPKRLSEVSQLVGFRNVTSDLGILVRVAREALPQLEGRSHVTAAELDRAERLEAALWHAISASEGMPTSTSTASRERVRALTLLSQAYDELCRIVEFLRWDEGDAETIAPSMYGFHGRRSPRKKDAEVEAEASAAPEVPHSSLLVPSPASAASSVPGASMLTPRPAYPSIFVPSPARAGVAQGMPDEDPFEI